jgi:hypothetical protein
MKPSNGSGAGEAFIELNKIRLLKKMHFGVLVKIALAIMLGKVSSMVTKTCKPDNLDGLNLQAAYSNYFHI